jgi:disulfide bond formation protein DsbB
MMRDTTIPLPWAGLILTLALLGQEVLLRIWGSEPSMTVSLYRIAVMAIGVVSLVLILLPRRRLGYLLGFILCAALMGWAFWLQYGMGLEPCPLCLFQRVAVTAIGIVFLVGLIHNPQRFGAAVYAGLIVLFAGIGVAFAARHVYIQALPTDQVPACGMGISYMLETMPFFDVVLKAFGGSGECADKAWVFLNLSIAGWTFVFFIAVAIYALALIRRD